MSREIINAARARLTEQAQKEGTELATFIEEHINAKLTTVEAAKKVEDKNLSDLIKKIVNTARKKAKNNCAALSSEEVAKIADEFYGFTTEEKIPEKEKHEIVDVLDLI